MKRTKLEMALDILNTLSQTGPVKLTHLMRKTGLNCNTLSKHIESLTTRGLVERRIMKQRRRQFTFVWAITQHGFTVLKHYLELTQTLPLEDKRTMQKRHYLGPMVESTPF